MHSNVLTTDLWIALGTLCIILLSCAVTYRSVLQSAHVQQPIPSITLPPPMSTVATPKAATPTATISSAMPTVTPTAIEILQAKIAEKLGLPSVPHPREPVPRPPSPQAMNPVHLPVQSPEEAIRLMRVERSNTSSPIKLIRIDEPAKMSTLYVKPTPMPQKYEERKQA
jgi:hypothetical protein